MFSKAALLALVPTVFAGQLINVKVGNAVSSNNLTFTPNSVTCQNGDTIQYTFQAANHTVTSGNPAAGCTPDGKFFSGFVPVAAGSAQSGQTLPSFTIPCPGTGTPQAVYCSAANHCQLGMVMVINPAANGPVSLNTFKQTCAGATSNKAPQTGPTGGTLANLQKAKAATNGAGKAAGTTTTTTTTTSGATNNTGNAGTAQAGKKGCKKNKRNNRNLVRSAKFLA